MSKWSSDVSLSKRGHGEQPRPLELEELVISQAENAEVVQAAKRVKLDCRDGVAGQVQYLPQLLHVLEDPVVVQDPDLVVGEVQQAETEQRREAGQVQHAVVREEQRLGSVGHVGGQVGEAGAGAVDGVQALEEGGQEAVGAVALARTARLLHPVLASVHRQRPVYLTQGQQEQHPN
ncbi:hypothetical protein C0Q70_15129 [Pomacea canaliculata]|uniref:Uncharacterized protein n=1 Tax=Pomacea canaliculata TaxID=400727 RepID=A0A2T7NU08_POMCA|nr:hypothetical protein C0Q70_15129 [Pomacea canaliculata]